MRNIKKKYKRFRILHNDVVDGDVDELDEEANEAHDAETDGGGERDLLEFLSVGLGALLDESIRVLEELLAWLDDFVDLVHLLQVYLAQI